MQIAATSVELVHVPVTPPLSDVPVKIAIVTHRDNPSDDEWVTAAWGVDEALLLVGPGTALTLTAHTDYRVWITFDPPGSENIVELSGYLSTI